MKQSKHIRLRSLAAFLVPVAFAVWMMQPMPVGALMPTDSALSAALVGNLTGDACSAATFSDSEAIAELLSPRWSVRTSERVHVESADIYLMWGDKGFLLRPDRQYLLDNGEGGFPRQLPGKPLYAQVLALLDVSDLPAALQSALEQEART